MLSKSDLQSFRQCPRKLWLEHRAPSAATAPDGAARRRQLDGIEVGKLARAQLAYPLWPAASENKTQAAADALASLAQASPRSAVEFPMLQSGLYGRADALIWTANGYVLSETRASTFPLKADKVTHGQPEENHLADVAIQTWLTEESGLPVSGVELNLIDNRWRYPGAGDYAGLFRPLDVTGKIQSISAKVPAWLAGARSVLAGQIPQATRGKQCNAPYPCPFYEYCGTLEPPPEAHPIDLLPDAGGKALAKRLRAAKGYVSILQPDPEELAGPNAALYRRIQAAHRLGVGILEPGSAAVVNALPFPRYYFDFEGINLPVPRWCGVRPFEQIPFQWSCHIERAPGIFEHAEFLDLSGDDPSEGCIAQMIAAIDLTDQGCILVYSENYERGVLRGLADRHPRYYPVLHGYIDRLVDLLPIVKNNFYHPSMRGSFSIKRVSPVVAEDLDYSGSDDVQDGTGAQLAYLSAAFGLPVATKSKTLLARQLRTYCCQDTWAMVELVYFLAQVPRPLRPTLK